MSQFRRTRNVAAVGLGLAALLAGCTGNSGGGGTDQAEPTTTSTGSAPTATPQANPLNNSDAATKLCDALRRELGQWEMQTPTPNRVAFNVTLMQWAFDAGGINGNLKLVGNKPVVDQLTTQACPDVRNQTLTALNVPTLAAAVAP